MVRLDNFVADFGRDRDERTERVREVAKFPSCQLKRRWRISTGIGLFGRDAKAAVPRLVERLDDSSRNVRSKIAWALGRIGPAAKSAVPKLVEMVEDDDRVEGRPLVRTVGEMVRAALWQIDPVWAREADIPPVDFPWDRFGKDRGR